LRHTVVADVSELTVLSKTLKCRNRRTGHIRSSARTCLSDS
jgi:hypothetical protein